MNDREFLQQAIALSQESTEPVKCASILVDASGKVIARKYNSQRTDNVTAAHAEMKAIATANAVLGRKLDGVTAYGNCEPCTMCLTALIFARVERIVFAKRLNDFAGPDQKIDIDCFEFVTRFPHQPKLEFIEV
jgi:guanine deaminase